MSIEDNLEHALSKVGFSIGTDISMLPRNLNLSNGKSAKHNKKKNLLAT